MKKLLIISVLLLSLSSCVSTKNIVDKPVEGTFIQIKNERYQVYHCKYNYIIKTDSKGRTIRQVVYLGD
jgi:hypothetical protein